MKPLINEKSEKNIKDMIESLTTIIEEINHLDIHDYLQKARDNLEKAIRRGRV